VSLVWCEERQTWVAGETSTHLIEVMALAYTTAVVLTPKDNLKGGYDDRWCYHSKEAALAAIAGWDRNYPTTEPQGWHRHPTTGRRREGGDPTKEVIVL